MVQKDDGFKKRLRETFKLEAEEHIRNLSSGLLELEKTADTQQRAGIIENIFRESHSLKGSARIIGMTEIESVCQSLENVFSALKRNELGLSPEMFDGLHAAVDNLGRLLAAMDSQRTSQEKILVVNTVQILENMVKDIPESLPKQEVELAKTEPIGPPSPSPPERMLSTETIRIATSRLESLLLETEELVSAKQAANRLSQELGDLDSYLVDWRREWQKIAAYLSRLRDPAGVTTQSEKNKIDPQVERLLEFLDWNHNYVKSLEDRISALAAASKRDGSVLNSRINDLSEDMKKVLMSSFSSVVEGFPKFVRDLAREQGKEIELVIRGEEAEIDRRILEEMKDPLTHMIRNCVDHGIEKAEIRRQKGKPRQGTLTLAIAQKGSSNIEITVADDGQGIDIPGIRQAIVKHHLVTQEEAEKLNETEVLAFIYRSGISTNPRVTDISGRGLGLAITYERVEKLRGTISVQTQKDLGTEFRIVVPLTLAEFSGLAVRAGGQLLVIPTINVERVVRVKKEAIQTVESRETIGFDGQVISLVNLSTVLGLSSEEKYDGREYLPIMILNLGGMRLAFLVDEIIEEQEVLVKGLGKQLSRVRNVAGASILADGHLAPVLNISDLMKSAVSARAAPVKTAGTQEATPQPTILVVEDSITARTLLKNILETAGYRVRTAIDGIGAFTQLKMGKFDVVVSDIDMPRMNGFDLTVKIRGDRQLAAVPVILVTALESREHRERGIDVGANAYIVKSSFEQGNLLEAIRRLI